MRPAIVAALILTGTPALAKGTFPVSVPPDCILLAEREGVPVVINNRYEAMKAKYKLYRLNRHDPLVQQCRAAVERARQAARHSGSTR